MTSYISIRREQLEPGALVQGVSNSPEPNVSEMRIQASIAISLKRIADALTNSPVVSGNVGIETTSNLEQIAWSLGRSFEQGRRTDR